MAENTNDSQVVETEEAVSYTHLDVYKRQDLLLRIIA